MNNNIYLSVWVKRYLLEFLMGSRNLSRNTQQSYRDTLRLLLPFVAHRVNKAIDQLSVTDISTEKVKHFLLYLEQTRHCSITTRNQRLSAIHAFAQFIGLYNPENLEWCRQIRSIPFKKITRSMITYLEKFEMDTLLGLPDRHTDQGQRDYALLLFLYNTGARADEVAQLTIADIDLAHAPRRDFSSVLIRGKGNKLRRCPLWFQTVKELSSLVHGRPQTDRVFLNRRSQPLTRFGIHDLVKRYVKKAISQVPSLANKCVSPHTIRHTSATHLLRAGVDINTIRAWLGHVSINTTNIYAEVDFEKKAKALSYCEVKANKTIKSWRKDKGLMEFLDSL